MVALDSLYYQFVMQNDGEQSEAKDEKVVVGLKRGPGQVVAYPDPYSSGKRR